MPLHDFAAANAERVAKKGADPFQLRLTENGPTFSFLAAINSIAFIAMYSDHIATFGGADDRSLAGMLYDCVIPEQREALHDAIVDISDPVDSETFGEAVRELFAWYTRGASPKESSSSSESPTPDGPSLTDDSSPAPAKQTGPVYDSRT